MNRACVYPNVEFMFYVELPFLKTSPFCIYRGACGWTPPDRNYERVDHDSFRIRYLLLRARGESRLNDLACCPCSIILLRTSLSFCSCFLAI